MDAPEYTTKSCTKCREEKPATPEYFHRHRSHPDGLSSRCKKCVSQDKHDDYQKHREKRLASIKKYHEQNREKIDAQRAASHEKYRQKSREYYRQNREERIAASSLWFKAHPDYQRKRRSLNIIQFRIRGRIHQRTYRSLYPHCHRTAAARRRARKVALPDTWTSTEWQQCLEYWRSKCAVCGYPLKDLFNSVEPHADHWIPLSYKGDDNPGTVATNMICLCNSCNCSKSDMMPEVWLIKRFGKGKTDKIMKRIIAYFEWVKQGYAR